MNARILLLVLLLVIAIVYYLKTYTVILDFSNAPTETFDEKNINDWPWETPPDWSFDWDGGHGKARHDIMMEEGPYFQPVDVQMIPNVPNL